MPAGTHSPNKQNRQKPSIPYIAASAGPDAMVGISIADCCTPRSFHVRRTMMNKKIVRLLSLFFLLLVLLPSINACNTTRGLGQDIEELGDNIEDEAVERKTY